MEAPTQPHSKGADMNQENLKATLMGLESEVIISRILIEELLARTANPEQILSKLQLEVDKMSVSANRPERMDQEQVIELRARMEQTVLVLKNSLRQRL